MKYFKLSLLIFLFNVLLTIFVKAQTFCFDFNREIKPSIRIDYGIDYSSFRQIDKQNTTNTLFSFGTDLGFASSQDYFPIETKIKYLFKKDTMSDDKKKLYNADLVSNSFWGLGVSYLIHSNEITETNLSSVFVFGPIDLKGEGYKFAQNFNLKLLTGNNISWYWIACTEVDYKEAIINNENNEETIINNKADINCFGSSVRFGKKYHSEIALQVTKNVSICGEARRLVIFPRTLFWKWASSDIIFGIGGLVLKNFTNSIKRSSPYMYPAIDFILRTGLNYGITELQKKKMNWPFNTVSPLMIEQYRVGLQFEF